MRRFQPRIPADLVAGSRWVDPQGDVLRILHIDPARDCITFTSRKTGMIHVLWDLEAFYRNHVKYYPPEAV